MAYYNTCPHCGCNLDPGERCDCLKEQNRKERSCSERLRKQITEECTGQMVFQEADRKSVV